MNTPVNRFAWRPRDIVLASVVGLFYYLRIVKVMWFDDQPSSEFVPMATELRVVLGAAALFIFPVYLLVGGPIFAAGVPSAGSWTASRDTSLPAGSLLLSGAYNTDAEFGAPRVSRSPGGGACVRSVAVGSPSSRPAVCAASLCCRARTAALSSLSARRSTASSPHR